MSEDLPVSTGGLGSPHMPLHDSCFTKPFESLVPIRNASQTGDSSQVMRELQRVFDSMDEDHDGELSDSELSRWMKKLGLQYADDGMIRMLIQKPPRIGSEKLNFSEFVSLNKFIDEETTDKPSFTEAHLASLYEVFELFDRNHNGLITPQELRYTLENLGLLKDGKDTDYVDMINRVDTDGDGQVSFSEFRKMMDG